jgi:predicted peroxiredoxin
MPQKKHAFVIYAGPNETGRVFHALTHAKQTYARGEDSEVYFAAKGTYWPGVLANAGHSMHSLFREMLEATVIKGACENCAAAFGHTDSASAACGLVRGSEASFGQIDILGLEDAGWRVWLF